MQEYGQCQLQVWLKKEPKAEDRLAISSSRPCLAKPIITAKYFIFLGSPFIGYPVMALLISLTLDSFPQLLL